MADPRRIARQRLESLQRAGVKSLKKGKPVVESAATKAATSDAATTRTSTATPAYVPPAAPTSPALKTKAEREAALDVIRRQASACPRCPELCSTRKQTVFGVGNSKARLCFLGEAPGADEDAQGEPFVGRAGQLLTKIIEACTLRREDVYILNVLKCRPPNNRPPTPEESANCREYLEGQLDIIRPEFICCLGATAAKQLLGLDIPISKLRGTFQTYRGMRVMCTYHPAYLLRNPDAKRDVWDDMKKLLREMGIELEKK